MGGIYYVGATKGVKHATNPDDERRPRTLSSATREKLQLDALPRRIVGGHVLYSHVVAVEARRLIFISGQLARDRNGNIVGRGDMGAQIRQVGENLKAALAAAGATLDDLVKTTTFVTDIEAFFKHADVRAECFRPALPTSTTVRSAGSRTRISS